ncbi:P-loop containing nucleoside triphosphate hydrolase protein, partial [Ochromonadaceae sp. CCMP2298]
MGAGEETGETVAGTEAGTEAEDECVTLSVRALLLAALSLQPCAVGASGDTQGAQFLVKAGMPVELGEGVKTGGWGGGGGGGPGSGLFGVQEVQQRLLRAAATLVPALLPTQPGTLSVLISVRRCSGIVLYGPPGSGKTELALWLGRVSGRHMRLLHVPCADLLHKVVGDTEQRIAQIFSTARELAPCIVLLDNIDMLLGGEDDTDNADNAENTGDRGEGGGEGGNAGASSASPGAQSTDTHTKGTSKSTRRTRSTRTRHKAVDRLLSSLLVEIDGLESSSHSTGIGRAGGGMRDMGGGGVGVGGSSEGSGVLVIATSSSLQYLDRALIRPGRLEEHVCMQLPGEEDR